MVMSALVNIDLYNLDTQLLKKNSQSHAGTNAYSAPNTMKPAANTTSQVSSPAARPSITK